MDRDADSIERPNVGWLELLPPPEGVNWLVPAGSQIRGVEVAFAVPVRDAGRALELRLENEAGAAIVAVLSLVPYAKGKAQLVSLFRCPGGHGDCARLLRSPGSPYPIDFQYSSIRPPDYVIFLFRLVNRKAIVEATLFQSLSERQGGFDANRGRRLTFAFDVGEPVPNLVRVGFHGPRTGDVTVQARGICYFDPDNEPSGPAAEQVDLIGTVTGLPSDQAESWLAVHVEADQSTGVMRAFDTSVAEGGQFHLRVPPGQQYRVYAELRTRSGWQSGYNTGDCAVDARNRGSVHWAYRHAISVPRARNSPAELCQEKQILLLPSQSRDMSSAGPPKGRSLRPREVTLASTSLLEPVRFRTRRFPAPTASRAARFRASDTELHGPPRRRVTMLPRPWPPGDTR